MVVAQARWPSMRRMPRMILCTSFRAHLERPACTLTCGAPARLPHANFDRELSSLRSTLRENLEQLLARYDPASSLVKRALLKGVLRLCHVFGREGTNDFVLPLLVTVLNDTDWQLVGVLLQRPNRAPIQ